MTVYVDPMFPTTPKRMWPYKAACHLTADTREELLDFGKRLYFKAHWLQGGALPHFDLTKDKRRQAVHLGAVEISKREMAERIWMERARQWRKQHRGYVGTLLAESGPAVKPGIEDIDNPARWKPMHWWWFVGEELLNTNDISES